MVKRSSRGNGQTVAQMDLILYTLVKYEVWTRVHSGLEDWRCSDMNGTLKIHLAPSYQDLFLEYVIPRCDNNATITIRCKYGRPYIV
jgi:hypothetical protein